MKPKSLSAKSAKPNHRHHAGLKKRRSTNTPNSGRQLISAAAVELAQHCTPTKVAKKNNEHTLKSKKRNANKYWSSNKSANEGVSDDKVAVTSIPAADDLEEQVRMLQVSYCKSIKAEAPSFLEAEQFTADRLVHLASEEQGLEAKLMHAEKVCGMRLCQPKKPCKGGGAGGPQVVVLTSSAARAVELVRALPTHNRSCRVHKLFSKHIKVEEQVEALAAHLCIAVGTPNRVQKLADLQALRWSRLKLVLLDVHPDVKNRTMLDIPEVRDDFWGLYKDHLWPLLEKASAKMSLLR